MLPPGNKEIDVLEFYYSQGSRCSCPGGRELSILGIDPYSNTVSVCDSVCVCCRALPWYEKFGARHLQLYVRTAPAMVAQVMCALDRLVAMGQGENKSAPPLVFYPILFHAVRSPCLSCTQLAGMCSTVGHCRR